MKYYTPDLNHLLSHPAYKKAVEYSKLNILNIETIEERTLEVPKYEFQRINIKNYGYKIEGNLIKFEKSIEGLNFKYIYVKRLSKFIHLQDNELYKGEVVNNYTFKIKEEHARELLSTDELNCSISKLVDPDEYEALRGPFRDALPEEWTRPVLYIDVSQIFDKQTYDGSFPVTIMEACSVARFKKGSQLTGAGIWAFVYDLLFNNNKEQNTEDVQSYIDKINDLTARIVGLETTIKTIKNLVKDL